MNAPAVSDDLEALFDAVSQQQAQVRATAPAAPSAGASAALAPHDPDACPAGEVINRIGHLTRAFHDALRGLGLDKKLEQAVHAMPDAQDRLHYVAELTEQAAVKVLNAVDSAKPVQEEIERQALALSRRWDGVFRGQTGVDEFRRLAQDTHAYLKGLPAHAHATNERLLEIMMAQDFQDLTGQVIKRIVELARSVEGQLVQLLVETSRGEVGAAAGADSGLLNGPVMKAGARGDVVSSQDQVDDLLESLGF